MFVVLFLPLGHILMAYAVRCLFSFSITVDIQYYTAFRCTTQRLGILYDVRSERPGKSRTTWHCIVSAALLATLPVPGFTSHDCFVAVNLHFLNPSPFSLIPRNALPSGNRQNVLCTYEFVAASFFVVILFFRFHIKVKSYGICHFWCC